MLKEHLTVGIYKGHFSGAYSCRDELRLSEGRAAHILLSLLAT